MDNHGCCYLWCDWNSRNLLFVPDLTGEDLAIRDERFKAYLVENGWVGEMGKDDMKALADNPPVPEPQFDFEGERKENAQ